MGFYTQYIASIINDTNKIKIISIDAHPINNFRLIENLKLLKKKIPNIFSFVKIKSCAVGDRNTTLNLNYSHGLANAFISKDKAESSYRSFRRDGDSGRADAGCEHRVLFLLYVRHRATIF